MVGLGDEYNELHLSSVGATTYDRKWTSLVIHYIHALIVIPDTSLFIVQNSSKNSIQIKHY